VKVDVYAYLKAWEMRQTSRQPTPAEWAEFRARLQAIRALTVEVETHLETMLGPAPEGGERG
jgi:hypothetical protein